MNIGIVGLGLIGGSIGLKLQKLNHKVFGVVNSEFNEIKAKERNLANYISQDLSILKDCSLIILALPLQDLVEPRETLINAIPKNAIVTDVGSIKAPIVRKWEKIHSLFIGSHPMAGTEKKGVNAGNDTLFDNSHWIITPTSETKLEAIKILSAIVNSMECELCQTTPEEHDQAVSLISHLPIYISACLIETASSEQNKTILNLAKKISSSGFSDTSRVGGGNPNLGLDLLKYNKKNILKALYTYQNKIQDLERLIVQDQWERVLNQLESSRQNRNDFVN